MKAKNKKRKLVSIFSDPTHPHFFIANNFFVVEWVSVTLFSIEYFARAWATKPTRKYIFSFFGIIDLVSILPSFLGVGNFTFLKSARALRIIRLLRLLRSTSVQSHKKDEDYNPVAFNVLIYFAALVFALLTFGTLMFIFEPSETFTSIPAGMWWAFKVFLGGIAVSVPVTEIGEVFYVLTRFTGMLLLGLLLGVVGNIFRLVLGNK